MSSFQPIIKWSGSKRSQCDEIIKYFPKNIGTYYEPFCGGCSMVRKLLESSIKVERYVCSDLNKDLISLWNTIKENPKDILETYTRLWGEINSYVELDDKKKYFNDIRGKYNETHDPLLFFFIMRTTTNGMPRYNKNGEFNNSFHITRNGIEPNRLKPILFEWNNMLNKYNVKFEHCSYEVQFEKACKDDLLYLDPPYFNTKGMYFGGLDFDKFFNDLSRLNSNGVKYIMSFDGISGNEDNTCNSVPAECYLEHKYIISGNSSFRRVIGKSNDSIVKESLYMNFNNVNPLFKK